MSENDERMNHDEPRQSAAAWDLPGDLKAIEAKFSILCPRDDRLDRERLMFLAGRASGEPANRLLSPHSSARNENLWKRSFVAMTAVAATLLAVLLTRPAAFVSTSNSVSDLASSGRQVESVPPSFGGAADRNADVLSAGDARSGDIEQLLATRADQLWVPAPDDADRPALTPAGWRRFSSGAEPSAPSSGDSSALPQFQGVNS